ncbi:hypothetical protein DYBT9275_00504 [Dyadobacter sp. CECT 9275]|uniref:PKD domain-containing protein n=1 Tax=Dyadobacter helix TaxID=2822344 RepID=A0A916J853_9BACT|nr:right-handed parallel beta-helix repeat-containing protein [Dyadobacter sp. CECT 9275]CAG4990325.1 hypothetical protein DYBT9275_00504 [Dyadobacter sp. CECT 9275]
MNFKKFLLPALSFTLLLAACKEEEEVKPANTLTARAGADQKVEVGEVVVLDGTASEDSENEPFDYRWSFSKKPSGSTASISKPTTEKPTFVPDVAGDYELELTISNANGESSDRVLVTAAVTAPMVLATNITSKMVLEDRISNPDFPDYVVNQNVTVQAELTIKPGVVIGFARDTRLEVNDNGGVLIAKGEASKAIRLIGQEKTRGFWAGIIMRSGSSGNELEYVEVLHTGSKVLFSGIKAGIALTGSSDAQISVKNSLFENNAGYGLYLQEDAILKTFTSNTFRDNIESGISVAPDHVKSLDENSVFSGNNGRNVVEISGGTLTGSSSSEAQWSGFKDKTPYYLTNSLTLDAGLKLMPGVTLELARDKQITVNKGYLSAIGTKESKITIKGREGNQAVWKGMICYSVSALNVLEHTVVSGGGSIPLVSGKKANIAVYGSQARMTIKNTQISNSGGYGVYVNYQASINTDAATVNTFEGNADQPILQEK